jgi:hypothetical protein
VGPNGGTFRNGSSVYIPVNLGSARKRLVEYRAAEAFYREVGR